MRPTREISVPEPTRIVFFPIRTYRTALRRIFQADDVETFNEEGEIAVGALAVDSIQTHNIEKGKSDTKTVWLKVTEVNCAKDI